VTRPAPALAPVALLLPLLLAVPGCRSRDQATPAERTGRQFAAGIAHALAAGSELSDPYRCAQLADPPPIAPPPPAAGRVPSVEGRTLTLRRSGKARDREAVVGVVADTRGAAERTLAQARTARDHFARAGVELVLALGGLGDGETDIGEVLAVLADGPWTVVAIPGDREAIPAHRAAVAALAAGGGAVADGSEIRLVEMDGVVIATFPGAGAESRLVSGAEGCLHDAGDARSLAAELAARPEPRIWAGHAPPRQEGDSGSDLAAGGVHVGDLELAEPIAASGAHLVVHGLVDEAALAGDLRGDERVADGERIFLAAGALESMPVEGGPTRSFGAALVVRVTAAAGGARVRWERILLDVSGRTVAGKRKGREEAPR
jgi:hypothetical protein